MNVMSLINCKHLFIVRVLRMQKAVNKQSNCAFTLTNIYTSQMYFNNNWYFTQNIVCQITQSKLAN